MSSIVDQLTQGFKHSTNLCIDLLNEEYGPISTRLRHTLSILLAVEARFYPFMIDGLGVLETQGNKHEAILLFNDAHSPASAINGWTSLVVLTDNGFQATGYQRELIHSITEYYEKSFRILHLLMRLVLLDRVNKSSIFGPCNLAKLKGLPGAFLQNLCANPFITNISCYDLELLFADMIAFFDSNVHIVKRGYLEMIAQRNTVTDQQLHLAALADWRLNPHEHTAAELALHVWSQSLLPLDGSLTYAGDGVFHLHLPTVNAA